MSNLKTLFQNFLNDVYAKPGFDLKILERYVAKEYIEHVNGNHLKYPDWIHHVKTLKEVMQHVQFHFEQLLVEGDKLCAAYTVHYVKKTGEKGKMRIIGVFQFNRDNKITFCDELTFLMEGSSEDTDLASRD